MIWIVVRGSEDPEDWKANAKVILTDWKDGGGGKVHYGFWEQYNQVRSHVKTTVDKYVKEGYGNFYVTGHSLGGAVAELISMAIGHWHPSPDVRVQMISFGAPGVGDETWVKAFDKIVPLSTRVVNNKDLVTCLPGHNPITGIASRVGNLFTKGSVSNPFKHNIGHFLQWSNNAWRSTRWPSCARTWSIKDHGVARYAGVVMDHARCDHVCWEGTIAGGIAQKQRWGLGGVQPIQDPKEIPKPGGEVMPTICKSHATINPAYSACRASSVWDNNAIGVSHGTGQLDSAQGWSARHNKAGEWWQMDMGSKMTIGGVVTQGRTAHDQYVKSFKVQVSADGSAWTYVDGGHIFKANTADTNFKVENKFDRPVMARFVRIVVQTWNRHISMRAAVLHCLLGADSSN